MLARFSRLKNAFSIIFKWIITRKKPIKLQTLSIISFKKVLIIKKSFKLKTVRFFINSNFFPLKQNFQASAPQPNYCQFTRSLFAERTLYLNYASFEIQFKQILLTKLSKRLTLVLWVWCYKNYKKVILKSKKLGQKG